MAKKKNRTVSVNLTAEIGRFVAEMTKAMRERK